MALSQRQRFLALGGALAVTVALVVWTGQGSDEGVVEPAVRSGAEARGPQEPERPEAAAPSGNAPDTAPANRPPPNTPPGFRAARTASGNAPGEIRDIFAQQTWHVAPPSAPPGPPQPPSLPFKYVGKLIDNGQVTVYLEDQENRDFAVRRGDVINGTYRVKRITPQAVTFIYIPMNKQQILEIGSAN